MPSSADAVLVTLGNPGRIAHTVLDRFMFKRSVASKYGFESRCERAIVSGASRDGHLPSCQNQTERRFLLLRRSTEAMCFVNIDRSGGRLWIDVKGRREAGCAGSGVDRARPVSSNERYCEGNA